MVLRLFVPPGEGQLDLVPRRPDPIGANATLQYAVVGSTALAATYTSVASIYAQRVTPTQPISRTALFIRSSARLGLWAGVLGAAVNWYYHTRFVGVVAAARKVKLKPWKLYKWTKRRTVEDGCLAGGALGLAASLPTLFMRRPAIPRWTRCLGMTNIGACAGILGAHGYFQYTGERQKAYKRLDRRLKRRSLEFWSIFWDKPLMASFNPLIQQYIRHNGIWYTYHLPDEVLDQLDNDGKRATKQKPSKASAETSQESPEEPPYYQLPSDYATNLRRIDVEYTRASMAEFDREKQSLLKEAEFLLLLAAHKEYEYCHLGDVDADERHHRLQEIGVLQILYSSVHTAAHALDAKLNTWDMYLRHKAALEAPSDGNDALASWFPESKLVDYDTHNPALSIQEMEKLRTQYVGEIKRFEELSQHTGYEEHRRARWRKDLEDGRTLSRAVDSLVWELEKRKKATEERVKVVVAEEKKGAEAERKNTLGATEDKVERAPEEQEGSRAASTETKPPPSDRLEQNKS